jgi:hypothetical protein
MKISLFVLAGMAHGAQAQNCNGWPIRTACLNQPGCTWHPTQEGAPYPTGYCASCEVNCSQLGEDQCDSQLHCCFWDSQSKLCGYGVFPAYVSLEASEEASKSYLRAGQVKK